MNVDVSTNRPNNPYGKKGKWVEGEFEEDEDRPFTLKGWLNYLNNNSHSITWIVDTGV